MADLTPPESLKVMKPYMLLAKQLDTRDKIVAYFCRRYAMEICLKCGPKAPEDKMYLLKLMDSLEQTKKELNQDEAMSSDIVAQAHVENYALKIFLFADSEDRAAKFSTNLVKIFYKASLLFDVCQTFGELSEEVQQQKKYAKYKAANISKCLKSGETPKSGPPGDEETPYPEDAIGGAAQGGYPGQISPGQPSNMPYPPGQPSNMPYPPGQPSDMPYPPGQPPVNSFPPAQHTPTNPLQPGAFAPPSTPDQPHGVAASSSSTASSLSRPDTIQFSPEDYTKATKFCKFAISALQYDDVPTAITNLEKALTLLKTGQS